MKIYKDYLISSLNDNHRNDSIASKPLHFDTSFNTCLDHNNSLTRSSACTAVFVQQQILQEEVLVLQAKQERVEKDQILALLARKHAMHVYDECLHAHQAGNQEECLRNQEEAQASGGSRLLALLKHQAQRDASAGIVVINCIDIIITSCWSYNPNINIIIT